MIATVLAQARSMRGGALAQMALSLWDFGASQALVHLQTGERCFVYGVEACPSLQGPYGLSGQDLVACEKGKGSEKEALSLLKWEVKGEPEVSSRGSQGDEQLLVHKEKGHTFSLEEMQAWLTEKL